MRAEIKKQHLPSLLPPPPNKSSHREMSPYTLDHLRHQQRRNKRLPTPFQNGSQKILYILKSPGEADTGQHIIGPVSQAGS